MSIVVTRCSFFFKFEEIAQYSTESGLLPVMKNSDYLIMVMVVDVSGDVMKMILRIFKCILQVV